MIDFLSFNLYEHFNNTRNFFSVLRYPLIEDHVARYNWVAKKAKGKTLDVACGSGWGTLHILKNSTPKIKKCVGIDINPNAFKYAKSLNTSGVKFAEFNLLKSKNTLGKFDTVIAFEILEHFSAKDVEIFLNNLKRFCTKSTKIYISTPNSTAFSPLGYKWLPYHPVEYAQKQMLILLKNQGFIVHEVYGQRFLYKPLHKVLSYIILFPVFVIKNKTIESKLVKLLYAVVTRLELFIGKDYRSNITLNKANKFFYPKYFIVEASVS